MRRARVLSALLAVAEERRFTRAARRPSLNRSTSEPAEPFRIAGNLYHVGANDVAAFVITGPEGHVVRNGGYPSTAPAARPPKQLHRCRSQPLFDEGLGVEVQNRGGGSRYDQHRHEHRVRLPALVLLDGDEGSARPFAAAGRVT